jgi:WD40 repeat protein
MNLLQLRNQCTPMLQHAREWVMKVRILHILRCAAKSTDALVSAGDSYLELARDIGEAANFATYFTGSPAAESTPHLYISALATWTSRQQSRSELEKQFSRIPVLLIPKAGWNVPLMTIEVGGAAIAVAFSRDGMRIVSGSNKSGTVRSVGCFNGCRAEILKGHTLSVNSVAFSSGWHPDCVLLV